MPTKILILILLSCSTQVLKAQPGQYISYEWQVESLKFDPVKHEIPKGTTETRYTVKRKSKAPLYSARQYNTEGKITKLYPLQDKKQKRPTIEVIYDQHKKTTQVAVSRKGKVYKSYRYEYLENGSPSLQEKIRHNKIKYRNTCSYNADGNIDKSVRFGKGGKKVKSLVVYEYHDKYNKSKTTLYNGKGKIKKVWTYACKEEGEVLEKKKNQVQVCLKKEISDNVLTEVYQTFDEKGQTIKNVYKYHLADTSLFEQTRYNRKEEIEMKTSYAGSIEKILERQYYKKRKPLFGYTYTYDKDLVTSQSYFRKGKLRSKGVYTYNKDGFMTSNQWLDEKGSVRSEVAIEYIQ